MKPLKISMRKNAATKAKSKKNKRRTHKGDNVCQLGIDVREVNMAKHSLGPINKAPTPHLLPRMSDMLLDGLSDPKSDYP